MKIVLDKLTTQGRRTKYRTVRKPAQWSTSVKMAYAFSKNTMDSFGDFCDWNKGTVLMFIKIVRYNTI